MKIERLKICFILFLLTITTNIFGQAKIPNSIKTDLTLKPLPKPYESSGFIVEKGATLTILPGTVITIKTIKGTDSVLRINGSLIIGNKGQASGKPVIINGDSPAIVFRNAKIDINGLDMNAPQVLFEENSTGIIQNCKFLTGPSGVFYKMAVSVPTTGNLTIKDCLIEDKNLEIISSNFPDDLDKFILNKCAFTTIWSEKDKRFNLHLMAMTAFAYGTQCDCYINIEFKAFDWALKKKLSTEWYIKDEVHKKNIESSVKSLKTFELKLGMKPYTNYKQAPIPIEKDDKK